MCLGLILISNARKCMEMHFRVSRPLELLGASGMKNDCFPALNSSIGCLNPIANMFVVRMSLHEEHTPDDYKKGQ